MEDDYKPRKCAWYKCKLTNTVWDMRADFCAHIVDHIGYLRNDSLQYQCGLRPKAPWCRWQECSKEDNKDNKDNVCGKTDSHNLKAHFARVHSINVQEKVDIKYCTICTETFIDHDGDGSLWREHCAEHYATLFLPFETRVISTSTACSSLPKLITLWTLSTAQVSAGRDLSFTDILRTRSLSHPLLCSLCVQRESRRRCGNATDLQLHLDIHRREIEDSDEMWKCPVPSHTLFRRLRLPREVEDDIPPPKRVDLAHLYDDVMVEDRPAASAGSTAGASGSGVMMQDGVTPSAAGSSGPSSSGADVDVAMTDSPVPGPSASETMPKPKRKHIATGVERVMLNHYCELHHKQFCDIREHIPQSCTATHFKICDAELTRRQRGQFGPRVDFAEWCKTAPAFVPALQSPDSPGELPAEAGSSKKARINTTFNFKCAGCTKEYTDIGKHLKSLRKEGSRCKVKQRGNNGEFRPVINFATWHGNPDYKPPPSL
ncbi:hypothetical protein B0H13DRAFT_2323082 [Mycena leptocephala]|nr:hypothetical protein B0H13DRAFT_2323082 [Mycena leptocephala]